MKRPFLFLSTLLFTLILAQGQNTISIQELIAKTECKDFECYHTFMLEKGYSFDQALNANDIVCYQFLSDKRSYDAHNFSAGNMSIICFATSGLVMADLTTIDSNYFWRLLDQLKDFGFVSNKTELSDKRTVKTWYESSSFPKLFVLVTIRKYTEPDTCICTTYNFSISSDP